MSAPNNGLWSGLVLLGVVLALVGIAGLFADKIPFVKYLGHLPGDVRIEKENFKFIFPLTTCLLISGVISFIYWMIRKIF